MRRYAATFVVAERRTADQRDWAVLYGQRDGLWLTEEVTHVGQHTFMLAQGDETVEALTTWCGAPPDIAAPELDVVLTREQVAADHPVLKTVGLSAAAVTVTRLDVGEDVQESWTGVFTGPQGSYVSTSAGDDVRYRGADQGAVRDYWRGVVRSR